jgi:hypothetical protein
MRTLLISALETCLNFSDLAASALTTEISCEYMVWLPGNAANMHSRKGLKGLFYSPQRAQRKHLFIY